MECCTKHYLKYENERLQEIVESYVASGPTNEEARQLFIDEHNKAVRLEAEVKRLRAFSKTKGEALEAAERVILKTQTEVERLRTVIDEFFCGNVPHGLQEALEGSE